MAVDVVPVKGSEGGEVINSRIVALQTAFTFPNEPNRPVQILVQNSDVNPIGLTFVRTGKFANGDTMAVRSATVAAGAPLESVLFKDFPSSEFGTTVAGTADNDTAATILGLYLAG